MRLAVYCDYSYRVDAGELYAEVAFGLFLRELTRHCERVVVTGRLDPTPGRFPHLMTGVGYVPLPHYESGSHLSSVLRAIPVGVKRVWRMLDEVDVVWILGPNPPQVFAFALLAKLRRRRVVLGVRQHLPRLIRHRYPGNRLLPFLALVLEGAFRTLALTTPVVVVGSDLAHRYRHARSVHVTYVSLLEPEQIVSAEDDRRTYDGPELRVLSVGRLEPEKNPLLLADILAVALDSDPRWRLSVCGDGALFDLLKDRLGELGVLDRTQLLGYVPIEDGLWELYRSSHILLHVSFTEGVPQVLLEAFAARLPVVATDVGGVAELAAQCSVLVPPGDAHAAASALNRMAQDAPLRVRLVERATGVAGDHTIEAECARLAAFLSGD